jgi:hypothetical protein
MQNQTAKRRNKFRATEKSQPTTPGGDTGPTNGQTPAPQRGKKIPAWGIAPGYGYIDERALKGRQDLCRYAIFSPLQGSELFYISIPGAMPQAGIYLRRWRAIAIYKKNGPEP